MFDWVLYASPDSYTSFLYKRPDFYFEPQIATETLKRTPFLTKHLGWVLLK